MLSAQSEGQHSSLAAASLRKPALQELTDLNSPEFSPYLFSRQELTLAIPECYRHHHTQLNLPPVLHHRVFLLFSEPL